MLLEEDAHTEVKGTQIPRAEEGFLYTFDARLQSSILVGTMLLCIASETGAWAICLHGHCLSWYTGSFGMVASLSPSDAPLQRSTPAPWADLLLE